MKGLLLIAQFNFQRAAECFHSKFLCSKLVLISHLGDKNPSADILLSDSAAQVSSFRSAEIISTAPTVNLVFVFQSSAAATAKDKQNIRSEITRKSFVKVF